MKALKIIGIVIGTILAVVLIGGLVLPTHSQIERSVTINAPADYVWEHVATFAMMNQWSPWTKLDPEMKTEIQGEDGTVGAKYTWDGNDDVGAGEQTITSVTPMSEIVTHLHFLRPWDGEADATTIVAANEDGTTTVTWRFDSDASYPMNVMSVFMEGSLGADFEKGMTSLNEMIEANKGSRSNFKGFEISVSELTPRTYVGTRDTLTMGELEGFFGPSFGNAFGKLSEASATMVGAPTALYFTWDMEKGETEVLAGIPVAPGTVTDESFDRIDIAGKCLMMEYMGPYEGIGTAHEAMEEYMNWHQLEMAGPAIEEYVTDPTTVSDPSQIKTMLYYPVN